MNMTKRKAIYHGMISPLIAEIYKICVESNIPMAMDFDLDGPESPGERATTLCGMNCPDLIRTCQSIMSAAKDVVGDFDVPNASGFPYINVYEDAVAKILVQASHDATEFDNFVALVSVDDEGRVMDFEKLPSEGLFSEEGGNSKVMLAISGMMLDMQFKGNEAKNTCLVMAASARVKEFKAGSAEAAAAMRDAYDGESIDGVPGDAKNAIVVQVHRPEGMKFGFLPVEDDGSVLYQPMCGANATCATHPGRGKSPAPTVH